LDTALATSSSTQSRAGRFRLRTKITLPYVILALLVGMISAYIVTRVLTSSVEARFTRQLADAGHRAADALVQIEADHLRLWRQVRFTQGFALSVAAHDTQGIAVVALLAGAGEQIDAIDVLDATGHPLWAMHRDAQAGGTYVFESWGDGAYLPWRRVQDVLAGRVDGNDDKYADVVETPAGWMLYTFGPVKDGDRVVGVLLVGTRLDHVVRRLDADALARVTLYDAHGAPLASTLAEAGSPAPDLAAGDLARVTAAASGSSPQRNVNVAARDYSEALTPFLLRGKDVIGALGVAQLSSVVINEVYPARDQMIALFSAAVVGILLIGAFLAVQITRPVQRLVNASQAVADGDLTHQVAVESGDEIGLLAETFNRMVEKLRERRMIVELFGHYVGDEVRDEILAGRVQLGGERREVSILFADIRGFSSLAERSDAQQLLATLNEYFTDMIEVIEHFGGLVNKFGGDSTLAVFGVPLHAGDHARQAVLAALEMTRRLEDLNLRRGIRGEPPIRIGIGINTGEVVAGNVGSLRRLEYTVIGDPVNIAQRLSDLNKDIGLYSIFISASTYAELGELGAQLAQAAQIVDMGEVLVKGKVEPLQVYAVFAQDMH
jgi:class 3 adenylate cyclase